MEIVDAYTHCGVSKYQPIERVRAVMDAAGVGRAVLVQHLGEFDNNYLQRVVASDPDRYAGVCLVDDKSAERIANLEALARSGGFKGVRMVAEACLAASDLFRAAVDSGLVIVLYAPNGIAPIAEALERLLDDRPSARLVLTHLGNPDPTDAPAFTKYQKVWRLARFPQVHLQVSGMKMFCPYPHAPLHGLIHQALNHFGAARLIWGSNFPVVGDQEDYMKDLHLLLDGVLPIPKESIEQIAGSNALRLWW